MSAISSHYIDTVEHLPATPAVVVKLLALFKQPDRDLDEIVDVLRQDPSLTAVILRHSNSAYFGLEEPIVDIFEALMRLGFFQVYQIAMADFGSRALALARSNVGVDVKTIWRHSLAAAVTSGTIAKKLESNEGLAFTAGLLHDVGKIVMASAEGLRYASLIGEFGMSGAALQQAELKRFGISHDEVGAALLERWELPKEISVPVREHHHTQWLPPNDRLCAIVGLGNFMAHLVEAAPESQNYSSQGAVCAMQVLGLSDDDMAGLLKEAKVAIQHFSGVMGGQAQ